MVRCASCAVSFCKSEALVPHLVVSCVCVRCLSNKSLITCKKLWQICCRLPFQSSHDIREQIRLRREVVRLKREMNAVSAQDEFSKWAKLRRQHDKAMEEYDKKGKI